MTDEQAPGLPPGEPAPDPADAAACLPSVDSAPRWYELDAHDRLIAVDPDWDAFALANDGDITTLAGAQGALMCATPLTLAETASVFGEMLTFRALLAKTKDKAERKAMLAQKVEDMINTVVRQIAFYSFERKVHDARKAGELTPEQINAIWLEVQAESQIASRIEAARSLVGTTATRQARSPSRVDSRLPT